MKSYHAVLILSAVVAVACAKFHPLSDEFIAETNQKATTWRAEKQFDITEWETVKQLVNGVIRKPKTEAQKALLRRRVHGISAADIPESFNSAEQWPLCESIREIRDQSKCGSCWAVAAVTAMSDRICVHSNSTLQTRVSATDLTTCCDDCGFGCQGGDPEEAWNYWVDTGIVTGGLYNHTEQGCQAYFLPECEDHLNKCENYVKTPACSQKCDNSTVSFKDSLTFGMSNSLSSFESVEEIQAEIMKNGPIETAFEVYSDFVNYKSGIYNPTIYDVIGGHAVRFVGWGVENGVKYWKIANSWNSRWGENGYFRLIMGKNVGGIERNGVAALPKLN